MITGKLLRVDQMKNTSRLDQVSEYVTKQLPILIREATPQIEEAISVTVDSANEADKEAVLKLPVSITWNLDTNAVEVSLGVSVKHKFSAAGRLDDPKQGKLAGMEVEK